MLHFNTFALCRNESNALEAVAVGASNGIILVLNIAANLISFLALLAFANNILAYLGDRVGYPSDEPTQKWSLEVCLHCRPIFTILAPGSTRLSVLSISVSYGRRHRTQANTNTGGVDGHKDIRQRVRRL